MRCLRRPTEHALHMYIQLDKVHDMDRCQMDSRATHRRPEAKGEKNKAAAALPRCISMTYYLASLRLQLWQARSGIKYKEATGGCRW